MGDVSRSFSGGAPSVGNKNFYGGNIPFIRSAEINSSSTELFLTDDGLKNSSAKLVKTGDILYALYEATSGEVGRDRLDGAINQAILAIIPNSLIDIEYLNQWLRNRKKKYCKYLFTRWSGKSVGTNYQKCNCGFSYKKRTGNDWFFIP